MNYKRKALAVALSLVGSVGYAQLAHADDSGDNSLQRVDVIGSHIKRLKSEKATEVTTIKVSDLTKQGLNTVEQVVNALAANQSNIGATSSVGASTGGAAFANLRGLGRQYTLVLLDGRRVSLHPFDGYAADLNAIPLSAIERVDVLPDGATAIYGSDAIGGVINFITKKTDQGLTLGGDFLTPQRAGGNEKSLTGSYGHGDLAKDGFNVYADVSYHKTDQILASQRDFASAITAASKPSSNSYPGNYDVDLKDHPVSPSSAYPNCPSPTVAKGGVCKTYPSTMIGIQPEVETWSGFAKATMRLGDNHDFSVSYNITRNKNTTIAAPTPTGGDVLLPSGTQGIVTPTGAATLTPFLRTMSLGNRFTEAVNVQQKLQFNLEGQLAGWDYKTGAGYAQTYASEELVSGFTGVNEVKNAYLNNQISLVTGLATDPNVWNQIGIRGHLDDGTYNIASADFSMSKEVMALPAGPLAVAFGGEVRHESLEHNFNYSISKDALGPGMLQSLNTKGGRSVSALFAEADIPIIKHLDGKIAARYDHYNDVGNSFSPQFSLRYELSPQVLLRTSASTGFRAPALLDMYQPNQSQLTGDYYADPLSCPSLGDSCPTQQRYIKVGGNTKLQPEKSSSLSVGVVLEPVKNITASADLWWVMVKHQVNSLSEAVLFDGNHNSLLYYDSSNGGNLTGTAITQNMGNTSSSGLDIDFRWAFPKTAIGNFNAELSGTYLAKSVYQLEEGGAYYTNLGQYVATQTQPTFRWQHNLTLNWNRGAWSGLLSQNYKSGYTDQNSGAAFAATNHMVKPYSTWNMSGSYEVNKQLTLTAGVRNLFDQLPPWSNQQYLFQGNYDARFADQVGRAYFMKFNYKM